MKIKNYIKIIILLILVNQFYIFPESKIKDERRFQIGLGFVLGAHSFAGLSEISVIYNSLNNNSTYCFPLSSDNKDHFRSLNKDQKTNILIGHILGGWEYTFQLRLMWNIFIAETDIAFTPFDAANNGRFDFIIRPMIGIKAPLAIMPYIMVGINYTFSFYVNEYILFESQKLKISGNDRFSFTPGLSIKTGLEFKVPKYLKAPKLSVGGFMQYTIKNFEEFSYLYWNYKYTGLSTSDSILKMLSNQLRFGISLCFYIY